MKISAMIRTIAVSIVFFSGFGSLYAQSPSEQSGKEKAIAVRLEWVGHASFKISEANTVIYIDPWNLKNANHDATVILVSHSHFDHFSAPDIEKISKTDTKIVAPAFVAEKLRNGKVLKPGKTVTVSGITITGVAAYNPEKQFHPKSSNWLGFVMEIGGKRIYYAGDTDITDEMKALKNIYLALLPVGGTYTMSSSDAAKATGFLKPKIAIPYHWGEIVGTQKDAEDFKKEVACPVTILKAGASITLE